MTNQAQTLLDQRNPRDELIKLAKLAAVKVFVIRFSFKGDDTKKYQFEDGSELVIGDRVAYVVS